jgi:hypothetical protein
MLLKDRLNHVDCKTGFAKNLTDTKTDFLQRNQNFAFGFDELEHQYQKWEITTEKKTEWVIQNIKYSRDYCFLLDVDEGDADKRVDFCRTLADFCRCAWFHSQSSIYKGEDRYCLILPVSIDDACIEKLYQSNTYLLRYLLESVLPPKIMHLLKECCNEKAIDIARKRFAYRNSLDSELYLSNSTNTLQITSELFTDLENENCLVKQLIKTASKHTKIIKDEELILNLENVFDKYEDGNLCQFLLSPLCEIIDTERIIDFLKVVRTSNGYNPRTLDTNINQLIHNTYRIKPSENERITYMPEMVINKYLTELDEIIDYSGNIIIDAPTGVGKSYKIEQLSKEKKVLVITPRKGLNRQYEVKNVEAVCYQKIIAGWTPEKHFDVVVFDEYHKLLEFEETREYEKFLVWWNGLKCQKILLSATPCFDSLALLVGNDCYSYYFVKKNDGFKMDIVKLLWESDEKEILNYIVAVMNDTQLPTPKNWIVYFNTKEKLEKAYSLLNEKIKEHKTIFRYYTKGIKSLDFEMDCEFEGIKKSFCSKENVIILSTVKMDVGIDLHPLHKVGVATICCKDEGVLYQFVNRCRKNITEVIVNESALTERQCLFFENHWNKLFADINVGLSFSKFYCVKKDKNDKYRGDTFQLHNQITDAKINVPTGFLRLAVLHRTMNFDYCTSSVKTYLKMIRNCKSSAAFRIDCDLRRIENRYSDNEIAPFCYTNFFEFLGVRYRYNISMQMWEWVDFTDYTQFLEYCATKSNRSENTTNIKLKMWKLLDYLKVSKDPKERMRYEYFGIKYVDGEIVVPQQILDFEKSASTWNPIVERRDNWCEGKEALYHVWDSKRKDKKMYLICSADYSKTKLVDRKYRYSYFKQGWIDAPLVLALPN